MNVNLNIQVFKLILIIICVCSLPLFLIMAIDEYNLASRLVAWILFCFGTYPMVKYFWSRSQNYLPVLELILLSYVIAFALPVLFQTEHYHNIKMLYPGEQPVTTTLLLALFGMVALFTGYKLSPNILRRLRVPRLSLNGANYKLKYYAFFISILFLLSWATSFGSFQGLVNIFMSRDLGIALLAILYYRKELGRYAKLGSLLVLIAMVLVGVSTSLTQAMIQPLMIWFICRWLVTGKLEVRYLALGLVVIMLIQPVKLEYRKAFWNQSEVLTPIQQAGIFSVLFYNYWFIPSDKEADDSMSTRSSLLLQTAHVIDWTPNTVPYRGGDTLLTMFSSFIPRAIWPAKPIAQQANIYYALDYGVTTSQGAETTMFGVGHLGEVYMNLGPIGIVPIFFLLGIF